MAVPTIEHEGKLQITPRSLNYEAFAPLGSVLASPLDVSINFPSHSPPEPLHPSYQPQAVIANQSTAYKYAPISALINNYRSTSKPQMSMFCCFPRTNLPNGQFPVEILERHPYTTQTFCPLGMSDPDTHFLVIVVPSLSTPRTVVGANDLEIVIQHPPDLSNLKAFIAKGNQAVTYAPGTWHAPMVVLGKKRVDFVVTQFVSGIDDEDCQEVAISKGIIVDMRGAKFSYGGLGRLAKI